MKLVSVSVLSFTGVHELHFVIQLVFANYCRSSCGNVTTGTATCSSSYMYMVRDGTCVPPR